LIPAFAKKLPSHPLPSPSTRKDRGGYRWGIRVFWPCRYSDGIAGLKPDEVPAILQRGEEVMSKKDRSRRSSGINLVMNVTTPNADSFRASQGQIMAKATKSLNRAKRNV